MCSKFGTHMMPILPFEILGLILLMLPAETLVRCQCVCMAWRDLIRDPVFIKRHFQHWVSRGNGYLLRVPLDHTANRTFRLLNENTFEQALDIEIPPALASTSFIVIGSCNGLLCITDKNNYGTAIRLCNPSISKCREASLPTIASAAGQSDDPCQDVNVALGFGYHEQSNDYKIVRLVFGTDREDDMVENEIVKDPSASSRYSAVKSKVEVYSMVANAWKNIGVDYFPWAMLNIGSEVVVNEAVHWKVIYRDTNEDILVILAFHLGNEVFQQINLPNYEADGEDLVEYLGKFKGNLSLFLFHQVDRQPTQEQCYLWVMMEYGVENSWTKTHSILVSPGIVSPLVFTRNDEVIYDDGEQNLVVCNFDSKTTRLIGQVQERGYLNLVTYMDSLVLLEG